MVCVGPPDSIKQGSSSVFINGKPAARMFDSTNHGGVIIGGSPNVFIGDAGCYPDPQDSAVASSDSRLQSNEDKQVAPPTKQSTSRCWDWADVVNFRFWRSHKKSCWIIFA